MRGAAPCNALDMQVHLPDIGLPGADTVKNNNTFVLFVRALVLVDEGGQRVFEVIQRLCIVQRIIDPFGDITKHLINVLCGPFGV